MRSSLGKLISLIGWVSIAFLGLVMLLIALGITHFESNEVRGWIVIATGIPTGVVLVVAGKTVRHEGPIWRAKRLRDMQQRDEEWRRKRKEDLLS